MNRAWDDDERPPTDDAVDPDQNDEQGKPVGRRIVLGMLGLGALGIVFGKQLQNAQSDVLAPVVACKYAARETRRPPRSPGTTSGGTESGTTAAGGGTWSW